MSVSREDDSVDVILPDRSDLFGSDVPYQHRSRCDVLLSILQLIAVRSGNRLRPFVLLGRVSRLFPSKRSLECSDDCFSNRINIIVSSR